MCAVMNVVVRKYGGSSLATSDRLRRAAESVAEAHRRGQPTLVVVSARGDTTDELLAQAGEVTPAPGRRETDQLLATGECVSAALMAMALDRLGVPACSLTGAQAGVRATGKHGDGVIAAIDTDRVTRLIDDGYVVIVAGFQGVNSAQDVLTLGRGGSDVTAVALAAELRARGCEIYTDVDGVYTADPRAVPDARVRREVDAGVMAEMAFAGAKVLHPRAVELAAMHGIELRVRSSFPSSSTGTVIREGPDRVMLETCGVIVAITHDLDAARVLVHSRGSRTDLAAEGLNALARHRIPVDLVARSGPHEDEFRMGFTIRRSDVDEVRAALHATAAGYYGDVSVNEDVGKLSLIGMGLLNRPEYTARMLATLAAADIPTSWVSTSQLRTSVTVPRDRVLHAVDLLHQEFDLGREDLGHDELDVDAMTPA